MIKNKNLAKTIGGSHFFTTPKSPKFTTTRFSCLMQQTFSLERCCKNQFSRSHAAWEAFFVLLLMQHGSAIFAVCNTSRARRRFFSFFQHLPSENHQNEKNRTSKPCCGGVSAEGATSKIGSKSASCPGIYDRDTFFNFTKKLTNRFNNVCNPPGISMITTSERLANFIKNHTISQNKFTKPLEL